MISLVVAHDEGNGIGLNGWMPWNLPEDLKHFKSITLHHKIVMGKTTFEGLKMPLPNRHTFVITRNKNYQSDYDNVTIVHDLAALLKTYEHSEEELMICGGAQIYHDCIDVVEEMWISLVEGRYGADTYFPEYDINDFDLISKEQKEGFQILHYKRKVNQ